jgi:hypothetical protein
MTTPGACFAFLGALALLSGLETNILTPKKLGDSVGEWAHRIYVPVFCRRCYMRPATS